MVKNECHPAAVVSDDVSHSKQCVLVFVRKILQSLLMDSVKTVHIWSDRPSSQLKNRYVAAALSWLQAETDIQTGWNFLAASHGKGAVDGIGGTIKRLTGRRTVTAKSIITDSVSFFNAVNNKSKVKVFLVPTAEIKNHFQEFSKPISSKILKALSSSGHIEMK